MSCNSFCRFSNDEDGPTCDSTPLFVVDRVGNKKTTTALNGNVLSNNNDKSLKKIKSIKEQNLKISDQSSTILEVEVSNMFLQLAGSNNSHAYISMYMYMCYVLRTNQRTILVILYINSGS